MCNDRVRVEQPETNAANTGRRDFLKTIAISPATAAALSCALTGGVAQSAPKENGTEMYGLIGKMTAVASKRDELIAILVSATTKMPGCLSYVIAKDATDPDAIWITEVWDSKASHDASLSLPQVRESMTKGRPLIVGFGERVVTTPVGGVGLSPHS
jgi:quinol monooxygenase YgiN